MGLRRASLDEIAVGGPDENAAAARDVLEGRSGPCLLYTSDAADERSSVDLGGRRIIKKKTSQVYDVQRHADQDN